LLILGHGEMGGRWNTCCASTTGLPFGNDIRNRATTPVAVDAVARNKISSYSACGHPHFELGQPAATAICAVDGVCLSVRQGLDEHGRTAAQGADGSARIGLRFGVLYDQ